MQTYQRIDLTGAATAMAHLQPDDSVITKADGERWIVETRVGGVYQLRKPTGEIKLVQRKQIKRDPRSTGYKSI